MEKREITIIVEGDASSLSSTVNARLLDGWETNGGHCHSQVYDSKNDEIRETWSQSMTKKLEV